jgi:hypothetical protein
MKIKKIEKKAEMQLGRLGLMLPTVNFHFPASKQESHETTR